MKFDTTAKRNESGSSRPRRIALLLGMVVAGMSSLGQADTGVFEYWSPASACAPASGNGKMFYSDHGGIGSDSADGLTFTVVCPVQNELVTRGGEKISVSVFTESPGASCGVHMYHAYSGEIVAALGRLTDQQGTTTLTINVPRSGYRRRQNYYTLELTCALERREVVRAFKVRREEG